MISVDIVDLGAEAKVAAVLSFFGDLSPVLKAVAESQIADIKARFISSTDPEGEPWKLNTDATLAAYLGLTGGNYKKNGDLTKQGAARLANKKPLIGHTQDLSRQFHYVATGESVTIFNSMIYAAMQQFGGTKAEFPNLWGDIPARRFLPLDSEGNFTLAAAAQIQQTFLMFVEQVLDR